MNPWLALTPRALYAASFLADLAVLGGNLDTITVTIVLHAESRFFGASEGDGTVRYLVALPSGDVCCVAVESTWSLLARAASTEEGIPPRTGVQIGWVNAYAYAHMVWQCQTQPHGFPPIKLWSQHADHQ